MICVRLLYKCKDGGGGGVGVVVMNPFYRIFFGHRLSHGIVLEPMNSEAINNLNLSPTNAVTLGKLIL